MDKNIVRKHYIFYGRVQGVGFRYHAHYAAQYLGITGWVKNLYDGTVEAEVQGLPEVIDKWLGMLNGDRYINIEDIDVKKISAIEENGFKVCG